MKYYTSVETYGNKVYVKEVDGKGVKRTRTIDNYRPRFFIASNKDTTGTPEYTNIHGEAVECIQPGNIKDCREFLSRYEGVDNFKIYGLERFHLQFIADEYPHIITHNMDHIDVVNIDIETTCNAFPKPETVNEEILLITIKHKGIYHTFGSKPYTPKMDNVVYYLCDDETDLLEQFLMKWRQINPDIVTGWNINVFDIPYLFNRMIRVLGENEAKALSPYRRVKERVIRIMNKEKTTFCLGGISIVDYYDLYKKYSYRQLETYKLDYVAYVELGEKKLSYDEHANMRLFYTNDWSKYVDYNIRDVELVGKLEDKLKLLDLQVTLAYYAKVNFDDVFSQVRLWDGIIYNKLIADNVVIPANLHSASKSSKFEGAFVKPPVAGMHEWVVSYDVTSLYPSVMMTWNISPETLHHTKIDIRDSDELVGGSIVPDPNFSVAANGTQYRKDKKGFIPTIILDLFDERIRFKKKYKEAKNTYEKYDGSDSKEKERLKSKAKMYDVHQQARKIALNSLYGSLGTPYARFFSIDLAEAVTLTGQFVIKRIRDTANNWLQEIHKDDKNRVLYMDTDSIFLGLSDLVTSVMPGEPDKKKVIKFIETACNKKLQPIIDNEFNALGSYCNIFENRLSMNLDVIADKAIWGSAKKRYALHSYVVEGVHLAEPDLKISGFETQKSSTPELCRNALKKCFNIIMTKDVVALRSFIEETRKTFFEADVQDIAFPRGVNGLAQYYSHDEGYKKGTPIHVKASLLYNKLLKDFNISNKYEAITEGEKIRFCYLKHPNPVNGAVIAFPSILPKEMGLEPYIDREKQFEKTFIDPLTSILDIIGWSIVDEGSLDDLFG